jgi:hypothetical protein
MFRQPIKATLTLSLGAGFDDQTFDGIIVVADIATAEFLRKFLLDGFIVRFLLVYWWQFTKNGFKNDSY